MTDCPQAFHVITENTPMLDQCKLTGWETIDSSILLNHFIKTPLNTTMQTEQILLPEGTVARGQLSLSHSMSRKTQHLH